MLRPLVPNSLATVMRPVWRVAKRAWYRAEHGFFPPAPGTDLVGYETLIDFARAHQIFDVPGDLLEVGAFCGGGSYKLAKTVLREGLKKTLYVVDCFDVTFDKTQCSAGKQMSELYSMHLMGQSQKEVFSRITQGLSNIVVIEADSKTVELPTEAICFAFIDGNHSPDYVRSDFHLAWDKLSPSGVLAFHDYGHDLPQVTSALDELCLQHRNEISGSVVHRGKHVLFIQKRRS